MSKDQTIDLDKLVADKIERGIADVSLCLENKKLGDDEIIRLAEMEILAEMTHLDLGENDISDRGLSVLCNSPFTKNLKVLNLKLKSFINPDKIIVAESGLKNNLDLQLLKENGIQNFLIGESLMREKDLTLATKKILGLIN